MGRDGGHSFDQAEVSAHVAAVYNWKKIELGMPIEDQLSDDDDCINKQQISTL